MAWSNLVAYVFESLTAWFSEGPVVRGPNSLQVRYSGSLIIRGFVETYFGPCSFHSRVILFRGRVASGSSHPRNPDYFCSWSFRPWFIPFHSHLSPGTFRFLFIFCSGHLVQGHFDPGSFIPGAQNISVPVTSTLGNFNPGSFRPWDISVTGHFGTCSFRLW